MFKSSKLPHQAALAAALQAPQALASIIAIKDSYFVFKS